LCYEWAVLFLLFVSLLEFYLNTCCVQMVNSNRQVILNIHGGSALRRDLLAALIGQPFTHSHLRFKCLNA
jgi:hypothetical protein